MQVIGSFAGRLLYASVTIRWDFTDMVLKVSNINLTNHDVISCAMYKISKFSSLFLRVKSLVLCDALEGCKERFFLQLLLIFQNLKMSEQAKKEKV